MQANLVRSGSSGPNAGTCFNRDTCRRLPGEMMIANRIWSKGYVYGRVI